MNKASVTLYLIIGLLIIMIVGFIGLGGNSISSFRSSGAEFSGMSSNMKIYIQSCLEQTALRAIDEYGLSGSGDDIEYYIDRHLMDCVDFSIFK